MIFKHIENKTLEILNELGINEASKIEVDKIAKHYGIDVDKADLDAEVSGFFAYKNGTPYIRYNPENIKPRQRFTIAHELGHYFLHKGRPLFVDGVVQVMFRNNNSSSGEFLKEQEANAFAASLLMPQPFIEKELTKMPEGNEPIKYLADKFGVSEQAMSFRLSNIGYDFGLY